MDYLDILQDKTIIDRYDAINKKINYVIDHGILHTNHVVKNVEMICEVLDIEEQIRKLALISAVLHDVGRLEDNKKHSEFGGEFSKEYLKNKLSADEISIIVDAITHHDSKLFDFNSKNDVAWILFLADKIDNVRSRYIPELITNESIQNLSYQIKSTHLSIYNKDLVFTISLYTDDNSIFETVKNSTQEIYTKFATHFGFDKAIIKKNYIK